MKKFLIITLITLIGLPPPVFAGVELPHDMPTIEALIALHKLIKKEEDKAMDKVVVAYGEQSFLCNFGSNF